MPAVRLVSALVLLKGLKKDTKWWRVPPLSTEALKAIQSCRENETSRIISITLKDAADSLAKSARPARRTRTQVSANPYVAGMPVRDAEKFFGREDVLDEIGNTLGKRPGVKSFVIYGARRSGKTSILLRIKSGRLGSGFLPVYVDM